MIVPRRAFVGAGVALAAVVLASGVAVGCAVTALRRGVRVAGFEVRAQAVSPSGFGLHLDEVHAEGRGFVVDAPRATVTGGLGALGVDAPLVRVARVARVEPTEVSAEPAARAVEVRVTAARVELDDATGGGPHATSVRVSALRAERLADRTIEVRAARLEVERGAWAGDADGLVASRSASRAWRVHARALTLRGRDDSDSPAPSVGLAPAPKGDEGEDVQRVADRLGDVFVSGRAWLEGALARMPPADAAVDRVLLDGGAVLPRLRLEGTGAAFTRDEAGARAHVALTTARTPAPLVLELRVDAADLRVRAEAHGGPLELEGDPPAEIAVDGEATYDAPARRIEARGRVRVRGLEVRRRWLGAAPLPLEGAVGGRFTLDPSGAFRLEDGSFELGAARALRGRVSAAGNLRALAIQADASIDPVDCNAAVASLPAAFTGIVGQLRFEGRKSLAVHLEASVASPEATQLQVRESGACTAIAAPKELTPQAFDAPFVMQVTGADGRPRLETFGPGTDHWRPIARVSRAFLAGVLTTEDAGFFRHGGVAWYAIRSALVDDLRAKRFVRGGSTITMQLAKNLFLNRDKNLGRKLEEALLTDYLEDAFGKERILELYANVVELGPDVFGVEAAARHYFDVGADELGVLEGMWLATLLPNPKERGHARRDGTLSEGKLKELLFLARRAREHGLLSDEDVADAERGAITLPRREGAEVRVPGHGIEPPRTGARAAVIEGP